MNEMRTSRNLQFLLAGLLLLSLGTAALAQQAPLSLREAAALSLAKSPERRMSQADVASAKTGAQLARTALLPNLSYSESVMRGNDPVYAFGTRLRQQRFQQSNFALNELNRPLPINDFTSRFSGQWLAFDSLHTQLEIRKADLLAKSSSASASRSDQEILLRVLRAYEAILLANREVEVAQHEVETAKALLSSSETRVQAGLAVDADKLSANVNLSSRQQELIAAQGDVAIAWAQLEAAIGTSIPEEQRQLKPLTERTFEEQPLADAIALALKTRPDRQSLSLQAEAQKASVASAKSEFGPKISTYGSWESDRQSFAGSGGNNWLVGAELRIDILPFAKREHLKMEKIALDKIQASADSADQQIRLEVSRAYYQHQTARQMVDVARISREQAAESLRILKDRYEAGLVTVTELLRAEDAQRQSNHNYWQSVFHNTLTYADLQLAAGTLTPASMENFE